MEGQGPAWSGSVSPSLSAVILHESGSITGFNGVLSKLIQSSHSIPIVTNITSILITSYSYNTFQSLVLEGFPLLQSIVIEDYCFTSVSRLWIQNLPRLHSIQIGSSSFVQTTSVQIASEEWETTLSVDLTSLVSISLGLNSLYGESIDSSLVMMSRNWLVLSLDLPNLTSFTSLGYSFHKTSFVSMNCLRDFSSP